MAVQYGYVRVSSRDQNIGRQMAAMADVKISKKNIYIDKQSGKDFERPQYLKLMEKLKPGDTLFVKSIDRLGRNYEEILDQWRLITRTKDVDIVVIDFPLLDTRNQINGITGKLISDIVLQILSYVAQLERENIHQRQEEGIKIAQLKGVKFGRPQKKVPKNFYKVFQLWVDNEISTREAARRLDVHYSTFLRWTNVYNEDHIDYF